jgi:hypothetical protein
MRSSVKSARIGRVGILGGSRGRERNGRPRHRSDMFGVVVVVALMVAVNLAGPAGGVAAPKVASISGGSGGIVVTSSTGALLARFPSLKCKLTNGRFDAEGRSGSWRFRTTIYRFSGFHSYDVDYGLDGDADFITGEEKGDQFSNGAEPKTGGSVRLTKAGSVAFPHGRGKLGIAVGIVYDAGDLHKHASVFGTAGCSYPRKRGNR